MVGEIRDEETASIAVQAAMTGHLVLGTLHTNDAATALPRLIDMKVPPFLIAYTTNLIVAQRLVRKICQNCITSYKMPKHVLEQLREQIAIDGIWTTLRREGVVAKDQKIEETTFWRGAGCVQCNQEGYKGRMGIYEMLEVSDKISRLINSKASAGEIKEAAIAAGMVTMIEDGFTKAVKAVTTIEEILRVTKE